MLNKNDKIYSKIIYKYPNNRKSNIKRLILGLPGRGQTAENMLFFYKKVLEISELSNDIAILAVEPKSLSWYPQPFGIDNQEAAVNGIQNETIPGVLDLINTVLDKYSLEMKDIILGGWSAGGVVTLQIAANIPLGAFMCYSGAILDTDSYPISTHQSPILVTHNLDDICFDWQERYLPMKKALITQGYNVKFGEYSYGGHALSLREAIISSNFLEDFV